MRWGRASYFYFKSKVIDVLLRRLLMFYMIVL